MTEEVSPEAAMSTAVCPNCNRFIGTASKCPYCHSDAPKPFMLRVLRTGSVVLAVAGLALLYLAVTHREMPVQNIGEITPLMNYAYVRLVGTVPRDAYVSEKNGGVDYISFLVKDATGSIRVSAQREVAQKVSASGRLPQKGMRVNVSGSLSVGSEGPPKMRLQTARHLVIEETKK